MMHTAVYAEVERAFPQQTRTVWNGVMHRACAEEHGNRIIGDIPDRSIETVEPEATMACVHCDEPLWPKED